jgi:hypothetical protein
MSTFGRDLIRGKEQAQLQRRTAKSGELGQQSSRKDWLNDSEKWGVDMDSEL